MQNPFSFFSFDHASALGGWVHFLLLILVFFFQVWMFIDAVKRGEYIWAFFIIIGSILSTLLYYFLVFRPSGGGFSLTGFELPGGADRNQIKKLQADIHHLDKAHHHRQLADIYFTQGRLEKAEASYRAAYERDSKDEDIRAHLGNCLFRRKKLTEALPFLQGVCAQNPKHDYGNTLMALAECQQELGQIDQAIATWRQVISQYGYSRARVQFAALLVQRQEYAEARKYLEEVTLDAPYANKFQRQREAIWVRKAKSALRSLPH